MLKLFNKFSIFNLHNRYIPALTLIALFTTLAYKNVNDIMISINDDGKIINISGRQRMLSQKLVIDAKIYLLFQNKESQKKLSDTIKLMEDSHNFLINKKLSKQLEKIYFSSNLDLDITSYITKFKLLIDSKEQKLLNQLREESGKILLKLDEAVQIYENENRLKMRKLKNREQYLYFLTLIALLFEAIFIFYPAAVKIKQRKEEFKQEIKNKTKELQNSIDIIDKNVIYSKTDLKGVITYASKAFCKISGYSKEDLVGQPHSIVRHFDMPVSAFQEMWDTIEQGKEWVGEVKNMKKNGDFYWVKAYIAPEYDIDGKHIGYAAVRHDISDKKHIEKLNEKLTLKIKNEIEQSKIKDYKLFEQEKRVQISEMIVNIAHHWRQPLSVISTCASGLQLKKEHNILNDDIFYEDTNNIIKASENLSKTIEVFSEFIKTDNKIETFFINSFIDELNQVVKSDLDQNGIDLIVNIKDNPIEITTIKNDLLTVVSHLIYNSRDILTERKTDNPIIKLKISKDSDTIVFSIEDNGGGIEQNIINKVFDPYFTTKHQSFNTGLGLYKSHMIITKLLKSDINVVNTDLGAKFTINLKNLT